MGDGQSTNGIRLSTDVHVIMSLIPLSTMNVVYSTLNKCWGTHVDWYHLIKCDCQRIDWRNDVEHMKEYFKFDDIWKSVDLCLPEIRLNCRRRQTFCRKDMLRLTHLNETVNASVPVKHSVVIRSISFGVRFLNHRHLHNAMEWRTRRRCLSVWECHCMERMKLCAD